MAPDCVSHGNIVYKQLHLNSCWLTVGVFCMWENISGGIHEWCIAVTILTKKISPTIDLSCIFISYLNLLNVLLRTALLRISLRIISSTRINLRTPSIIILSLLFLLFTTTSLSLWVNKKLLLYVFSIFLLPSIILIILFSFIASLLGLVLMAQLFLG